jgi:hypothetical protein
LLDVRTLGPYRATLVVPFYVDLAVYHLRIERVSLFLVAYLSGYAERQRPVRQRGEYGGLRFEEQ